MSRDLQHFDDVLFAFVLGCLSPAETTGVQVHMRSCRRCTQLLAQVRDDTAELAVALSPLPAPALIRESLMHSINEITRFYDLVEPVTQSLDCSEAEAQTWLAGLDEMARWDDSVDVGVSTQALPAATGPLGACFMRLQPGTLVPHEEGASPHLIILQGTAQDSDGTTYRPGDLLVLRADEHAELCATAGPELIYLSVQHAASLGRVLESPTNAPAAATYGVQAQD